LKSAADPKLWLNFRIGLEQRELQYLEKVKTTPMLTERWRSVYQQFGYRGNNEFSIRDSRYDFGCIRIGSKFEVREK